MDAEKMKKLVRKSMALLLVFIMSTMLLGSVAVSAEEGNAATAVEFDQNDYSPVEWRYAVNDMTKRFTGGNGNDIIANCYFERIVLVGFNKGIKKINKTLKKLKKNYDCSDLYEYAESVAEEAEGVKDIFCDHVSMDMSYCGSKYVSICKTDIWYAGGVSNEYVYGYVFDLNTGKKKSIAAVTGLTEEEIKEKLIASIKNDNEFKDCYDDYAEQVEGYVDGLEIKDMNYLIDENGQVVVLVLPYTEPFYGGWSRGFVLEGVAITE